MKAPFKTPVTEDTLIDFVKPENAEFIATAINSHEALVAALEEARDYMLSRGTYRGVKVRVDNALALAKGESK